MRKLATAAAVSLALASGGAFGLGLGEIEMRSALNQPMNAEIRLTSVKPGELGGMIVKLASPAAFARAGIERSQALSELRFSVDGSGSTPVIRISSNSPVVEPFLNFLLEVDWPQGRMVREYTVLLDPPVFMTPSATTRNSSSDTPARVNREDTALVAPAPIDRDSNAAVADSFEVEDVGGTGEVANDVGSGVGSGVADAGEPTPLDTVAPAPLPAEEAAVALTDLGAPNTAAREQTATDRAAAAENYEFDVEIVGDGNEVSDDVGGSVAATDSRADGAMEPSEAGVVADSEVVSLEELDSTTGTATAAQASAGSEVTVATGDTLYEIAESAAGNGTSVQQMMMALLTANRSAFIDGNINLVRAGSILRMPEASEARALTQAQAIAEVASQNELWQTYRENLRGAQATRVARAEDSGPSAGTDNGNVATGDIAAATDVAGSGLSENARTILEKARREVQDLEQLRIVASDESATGAGAIGSSADSDAAGGGNLRDIDRRLQLAREELSSTRLEGSELDDQATELGNTAENLDALVTLRQNEVAALERQLANARESAESGAERAAESVVNAASDASDASDAVSAAGAAVDNAADAAGAVADSAANVVTAAGNVAGAASNTLADAGETPGTVEMLDADGIDSTGNDTDATGELATDDAMVPAVAEDRPWYQSLLTDPARLAITGVGGAAVLGLLGTLLWRRRRGEDDDSMLDFDDQSEFLDDTEGDDAGITRTPAQTSAQASAAGAAIGAAGVAASAVTADDIAMREAAEDEFDATVDASSSAGDSTLAFAGTAAFGAESGDDGIDKDDTISEVEVYLAYGLHGQAEDLLTRAIDRDPNNPIYVRKLLDTYHAQGNAPAFHDSAEDFHARFGGESNPEWEPIAAMGLELKPEDALYASAVESVASVNVGGLDGARLDDNDFALPDDGEPRTGSIGRAFSSGDSDAPDLMDQSLDPAFAFDEADLEATGDFSQIASEVAAEGEEGIIEFPEFDEQATFDPDSVVDRKAKHEAASAMDSLDAPELDDLGMSASATAANERLLEAGSLADDLTLDLDELSGDLELDGTELLDADISDDLSMGDSTTDGEFADDGEADEMDTLMELARAYIDMGDKDSASSALGEIVRSGNPDQVTEAERLLGKIS